MCCGFFLIIAGEVIGVQVIKLKNILSFLILIKIDNILFIQYEM